MVEFVQRCAARQQFSPMDILSDCREILCLSTSCILNPVTASLAIPTFVPERDLRAPGAEAYAVAALSGSFPTEVKLLPAPIACSLPMLGRTFSPADSETYNAKGTSQTWGPKKAAASLKLGIDSLGVFGLPTRRARSWRPYSPLGDVRWTRVDKGQHLLEQQRL